MAARTIVTFHPDVECDVCGRRLLRGERPDVFLGGGQRRMVCELCTPRAAHEGWRREIEGQASPPRAQRPQRGRSLLGRLRQLREPAHASPAATSEVSEHVGAHGSDDPRRARRSTRATARTGVEPEWRALDEDWTTLEQPAIDPEPADATDAYAAEPDFAGVGPLESLPRSASATAGADASVVRALEIFNGSEAPRRIAGIARALGEVCVHVAPAAERESVTAIVVAWELCWYRYEIDADDATGEVRVVAEGMELDELPAEQRVANAIADEHGTLALAAG